MGDFVEKQPSQMRGIPLQKQPLWDNADQYATLDEGYRAVALSKEKKLCIQDFSLYVAEPRFEESNTILSQWLEWLQPDE